MQTLENYFIKEILGDSGKRVVIEECLRGEELSILALTDGKNVLPLASSQDHKRAFEGDQGPNTGGMGAYSPCPFVKEDEITSVVEQSVTPLIQGLAKEGIVYRGLLYAGLILTEQGPFVLEYNVRFGDPETQAVLPRLKSDLLPILLEIAQGELKTHSLEWDERFAVTVVMASKGYPGHYEKGLPIKGFKDARNKGCLVFHAGTSLKGKEVVNSGGRVLAVTGLGESLKEAAEKAYQGVDEIKFSNSFCRRDIAKRMYERSVSV